MSPHLVGKVHTHYLTIHDMGWISTTVTGETVPFDYEKLEACIAAQYGYGQAPGVLEQAAYMLDSFLTLLPYAYGNRRTAFIAVATFLTANGYALKTSDEQAANIVKRAATQEILASEAIDLLAEPTNAVLPQGVRLRQILAPICQERARTLELLAEGDR